MQHPSSVDIYLEARDTRRLLCMRVCIRTILAGVVTAFVVLLGTSRASGQYVEYPKTTGQVQPLTEGKLPPWMTLEMSVRGRTEDQTAINNVSGQDQLYELTRVLA